MVRVPWCVPEYCDASSKEELLELFYEMLGGNDWVEFLRTRSNDVDVKVTWEPGPMLYLCQIEFDLPPEEETMYWLRFR